MKPVDLEEVRQMIAPHVHVACDEYHAHSYNCLVINNPVYDTMERMRIELCTLRKQIQQVREILEEQP